MDRKTTHRILAAAQAKASEIGKPVSLAIVNSAGILVALDRHEDPPDFTLLVAEGKAVASAAMGMDSADVANLGSQYPALVTNLSLRHPGRFVTLQGAVVVRRGETVLGAIGVSGATSEEDELVARAGAAAV